MAGKKGGRAPASGAPQLSRRLREQLAQALGESAERAVAQVVARFEGELEAAAAPAAATAVKAAALDAQSDYDLYHACCVRLVRYIEANMETSAEFAQQMERIILACHSNASEHVLRSVVTKDLWFHRRQEGAVPRTDAPKDERAPAKAPFTLRSSQPPTPPPPPQPTMAPTATARTARAADKRRPAARTRSGSRDLSPPPKRPRRAAARIVVDSDSSEDENNVQQQVSDDNRDESEEEEEEEGEDAGGEEQEEKPAKGRKGKARSTQPHLEQGEERLLDFKDAIGELCYPENREPPQTKFFKDRLRRSILFVDAQLCKPPVGMFCSRDCKKLRAVMCNGDKPCKNKTCRIWHDVEVHTDRCENPQCEFKNRIMLRETMHKIDHCKQDLHRNRAELQAKRKHLVSTRRGEQNDREKFIEATLLENEITQLENDIEEGEEELGRLNGTRKAFWGILNDIGVKMSDDITDEFPDFDTHYTSRRPARKAKTAPKPKRESMSPPRPTTTPTRTTGRNLRSRGSGPHDENSASPATSARATRRSTRAISQDSDVQMIEVDEDEETKEEHSGDDEKDPVYELPDDGEDESEHEEHGPEAAASEVSELVENPTASERDTAANQEEAEVAEVVDIDLVVEPLSTESKGVSASVVASVTVESVIEEAAKELPRSQRASDVIGVENNGVSEDSIPQEIAPEESAPEAASPVNREERGSSFHEDEEENAFSAMNARWPAAIIQSAMAEPKVLATKRVQFARSNTLDSFDERIRTDDSDQPAVNSTSTEETSAPDSTMSSNDSGVLPTAPIGGSIDDDEDLETAKKLAVELQLEMLRGKLARRNQIIEVIRRAYYHDVIVVKEELRNGSKQQSSTGPAAAEDKLSSVPSVDLRDVLPLFAPSETVLRVHPCTTCGGHLELVHGESKELQAARQEMARASKGEQQMRSVVHRMRTEAKEMEEVNEALQQRVKALLKENAYTLEQLQSARKSEREQKTTIATLRSKLQLAQATQEEIDRLSTEFKDIKQQLIRSNHDRDIFSASNNHLKEELAEVTKTLHSVKVEKAQLESDFGTSYYRLQEELKKSAQLSDELAMTQMQLKDKTVLSDELQRSLSLLKEELATTLQRFEQTKRHLEDQLIEEERAREELQEQNLEFRKMNKKLAKDIEKSQGSGASGSDQRGLPQDKAARGNRAGDGRRDGESDGHASGPPARGRNRAESLLLQLERSQMRENDLVGALSRALVATAAKPAPMRRQLSRMPSTTVITRFVPAEGGADNKNQGGTAAPNGASLGSGGRDGGRATLNAGMNASTTLPVSEDMAEEDSVGSLEINEKNFEAYHQEVHRMLTEIEDGKDKISKQQKVITDMERRNHGLTDRLEEAKLTIEALTGSVNALKMRLNQDSAGAAEQLEAMMHQIEDGKRDRQFEVDKVMVLMEFLRSISQKMHMLCDNSALLGEIDSEIVPSSEDERATVIDDGLQMAELQRKKRELRRKVLMEKGLQKLSQQCYNRAGLIEIELQRFQESAERVREDLDQAENKIDSGMLQIRTLDAELAKLRLTVEMGKANVVKTERALRITSSDLQDAQTKCSAQALEIATLAANCEKYQEDEKRLTMMLFEKTKAWEKEVTTSNKRMEQLGRLQAKAEDLTSERDDLLARLKEIDDLAEYRRRTNCSVGVSVIPETTESEMQTDRWKPQGLILRQRNGADRMPQRYLGKASVMIACPELSKLPSPRNINQESTAWLSDGDSLQASMLHPESEELSRGPGLVEMNIYPSARVGGRQVKTSHAGARPKALSKLFLASDGISQRYQTVASDESAGAVPLPGKRPATTL